MISSFPKLKRARIEVPVPFVEKGKQPPEGLVWYVELRVPLFELVDVEESAIQVGNRAEKRRQFGVHGALARLLGKALVEQCEQKVLVKGKETSLCLALT